MESSEIDSSSMDNQIDCLIKRLKSTGYKIDDIRATNFVLSLTMFNVSISIRRKSHRPIIQSISFSWPFMVDNPFINHFIP